MKVERFALISLLLIALLRSGQSPTVRANRLRVPIAAGRRLAARDRTIR